MKTLQTGVGTRRPVVWLALLAKLFGLTVSGSAQLAITEVLTSASTNQVVQHGSDFWELTNFGTNTVALTGYAWNERRGSPKSAPFAGLVIRPEESIVFFRLKETPSVEAFRQWWELPETVQVISWGTQTGLNATQESVELWDAEGSLVDRVSLARARRGVSFTYDPQSGVFGALSVEGVANAFRAVTTQDIGSPGTTAGSVPAQVAQSPRDLEVDGGQDATFVVRANGVPAPRFQWRFRGVEVPLGIGAVLTVTNAQPADAGPYEVEVHNGTGEPVRLTATLTVNTKPAAPKLVKGLEDVSVYPGQAATFAVQARGYPALTYQWSAEGVVLPEAQGSSLTIDSPQEAESGTHYTVRVSNALGTAESSARLRVERKPSLHITELMAWPSTNTVAAHADWWELTNLETNVVHLTDWKFFDAHEVLVHGMPCSVATAVAIHPGESVIFVEGMSPEAFVAWWGATNLPPQLTVIPYDGFGLSSLGDTLNLWNPAATDPLDAVASAEFAMSTPGVSLQFTPGQWEPTDSQEGVEGVWRAVESDDMGSPGYSHHAPPRFLDVTLEEGDVTLVWQAVAGSTYRLQSSSALDAGGEWANRGTFLASGRTIAVRQPVPRDASPRFYRVQLMP